MGFGRNTSKWCFLGVRQVTFQSIRSWPFFGKQSYQLIISTPSYMSGKIFREMSRRISVSFTDKLPGKVVRENADAFSETIPQ